MTDIEEEILRPLLNEKVKFIAWHFVCIKVLKEYTGKYFCATFYTWLS